MDQVPVCEVGRGRDSPRQAAGNARSISDGRNGMGKYRKMGRLWQVPNREALRWKPSSTDYRHNSVPTEGAGNKLELSLVLNQSPALADCYFCLS